MITPLNTTFDEIFGDLFQSQDDGSELFENLSFKESAYEYVKPISQKKPTKQKKYYCYLETCRKEFNQLCSLQKHERIHRGEKPYVCQYCGRAFTQQSNLKRHETLHTGEKPYFCRVCHKTFSSGSNLKQHVQVHYNSQDRVKYSCQVCSKTYYYQSSLRKHMKEEHEANSHVEIDMAETSSTSIYKEKEESFAESQWREKEDNYEESQLTKKVKLEVGGEEFQKAIVEIKVTKKVEEVEKLPQNYIALISNPVEMKLLQEIALECAINGSNAIESFEWFSRALSSFIDSDQRMGESFLSINSGNAFYGQNSIFPGRQSNNNRKLGYVELMVPEVIGFERLFFPAERVSPRGTFF